ncbi:MAG: glycosyltransferase family 2 protein [Okeania sp. SIO3B5]|uniref:glycosyltransferase family 2 protein n=1 Tax=Okeania sp. SIO3B5 TaxID=2607811 RepID=UPI0013FF5E6C|nr:glycosyltransferase [Okeania sp. SIO3B5]NEO58623.1 glycosyltransferase family 2 protein [Okeania sp. SIO3B5]
MPLISIIIPVRNRKEITRNILAQIFNQISLENCESNVSVVVVNDGSTDGTKEMIMEQFGNVHLIEGDGSLWWTGAIIKGMEYGVNQLNADYLVWLNDDISLADNFLVNLISICSNQNYQKTIVGGLVKDLTYLDWIVYSGSKKRQPISNINMFASSEELEVDVLCGNIVVIPRGVVNKIGYPDGVRLPHHGGDYEYIMRAKRNGFRVILSSKLYANTDFQISDVLRYMPYWIQWYLQPSFSQRYQIMKGLFSLKANQNVWVLVNLHSSNIKDKTTPIWKYIFCYFNKAYRLLLIDFLPKKYLESRFQQYLEQQNFPSEITAKIKQKKSMNN